MDICSRRHDIKCFSVNKQDRKLIAEVSTLEANNATKSAFGRVYDDAFDEGFVIHNPRTGKSPVFVVNHIDRVEGEITYWELVPTKNTLRQIPGLKAWRVIVFND